MFCCCVDRRAINKPFATQWAGESGTLHVVGAFRWVVTLQEQLQQLGWLMATTSTARGKLTWHRKRHVGVIMATTTRLWENKTRSLADKFQGLGWWDQCQLRAATPRGRGSLLSFPKTSSLLIDTRLKRNNPSFPFFCLWGGYKPPRGNQSCPWWIVWDKWNKVKPSAEIKFMCFL